MKFFILFNTFLQINVAQLTEQPIMKDELGSCTSLTLDSIANLINVAARSLLEPEIYLPKKQVRFDLYTSLNPERRQLLRIGDRPTLLKSNFNPQWPVRYSIHGWNGHSLTCSNAAIKDAYLVAGNFNVIIVDWSDFSMDINYLRVIPKSVEIARQINAFSRYLNQELNIQYHNIYLIGHSLGCHIAGIAGKLLKPDRYGVIYALDTSGPIHRYLPANLRLLPTDAIYVEAIHTDVALMGYNAADLAHASFFPNWGLGQPHCPNITSDRVPDFACDHFASLYYFAESLRNSKAFGAIKCKNYQNIIAKSCNCDSKRCKAQTYMGGDPATPKRGIYYLSTRKTSPFGYGAVLRMRRPILSTAARLKIYNH